MPITIKDLESKIEHEGNCDCLECTIHRYTMSGSDDIGSLLLEDGCKSFIEKLGSLVIRHPSE